MITGAHAILHSDDADATRAALGKVLSTRQVDAGGGWLLFALPPAELAVHPATIASGSTPATRQGQFCKRQDPARECLHRSSLGLVGPDELAAEFNRALRRDRLNPWPPAGPVRPRPGIHPRRGMRHRPSATYHPANRRPR